MLQLLTEFTQTIRASSPLLPVTLARTFLQACAPVASRTWTSITTPASGASLILLLASHFPHSLPIHNLHSTSISQQTPFSTANGGQYPSSNYIPPSCPPGAVRCGTCHRVDNIGTYGSAPSSQIYGTVTVQIIDACPAGNAQNYCKTDVPADERCGSNETNSLDIDVGAYRGLTAGMMGGGVEWDSVSCALVLWEGCVLMMRWRAASTKSEDQYHAGCTMPYMREKCNHSNILPPQESSSPTQALNHATYTLPPRPRTHKRKNIHTRLRKPQDLENKVRS